jgi:eukaryotic-like serine/threonine-protein kinase
VISDEWKQVETLFERALELSADERVRFLQAIGDDELRREVESLLEAHGQAFLDDSDRFFSRESFVESLAPDEVVDRYRIIRELGRGGMGVVFLAERADDQYRKQVAIKLIKRGTDTDAVLRHFRNERQILAGFDHPNIARLLDGGTTEDGLPYFVMEYVDGIPIDEYCNAHALSLVERLKLFREVCAAVSYAHRHLVVHRDLKRSNILVTNEGVPKLLDFGIAKMLQPDHEPLLTVTGRRLLTPEYASPEQIRGEPVTTASDVYSLGVILYELLTGQFPYRVDGKTPQEIERAITTQEPTRPSTAIGKSRFVNREPSDSRFTIHDSRALRGDLDNIVLMALRKEPERRYQSVEQLSEDIRRHLENLPVVARRDTVGYRTGKFLRRNRTASVAAGLVLLTLIGGIIATASALRQANTEKARAERQFAEVRELSHSLLFDYYDAIKLLPGATKARERLVKDALKHLDRLAAQAHGDPALQRELAAAYERLGDVRGGASNGNLGDVAGAIENYKKALRIREALLALSPDDAQSRRDLAYCHQRLGERLLDTADIGTGLEHLRKARDLFFDLAREQPTKEERQYDLAAGSVLLAKGLTNQSDLSGALEQYQTASSIFEKLVASNPNDEKSRRGLWTSTEGAARTLWLQGDVAGGIKTNEKALALGEALIADSPLNAEYRRGLVLNYLHAGDYRLLTDRRGALEYLRRAAEIEEQLAVADPANALTRKDLAETHKKLAEDYANLHENSQALLHFDRAREIFDSLQAEAPADLNSRLKVATCRAGAAGMQARLGNVDVAQTECTKAIALLGEIPNDPTNIRPRFMRAEVFEYLGYAYKELDSASKPSSGVGRQYLSVAHDMFTQCMSILQDLRTRGALKGKNNEAWSKSIADEIAKCDATLQKAKVAPLGR